MDVEITNAENAFYPGQDVIVSANVKSLGIAQNRIDIKLNYEIIDQNGNIIAERGSTLVLHTSLKTTEIFTLPENIKSGKYNLIVKAEDDKYSSSSSESFYVESKFLTELSDFIDKNTVLFEILLFLIISVFIIILLWIMHKLYGK